MAETYTGPLYVIHILHALWSVLMYVFNSVILQNTVGVLDANGEASATLVIPPLPSLLGLQLSHAFLVSDNQTLQPRFASNAVPLLLIQ